MASSKASSATKQANDDSVSENWEKLTDRLERLREDLSEINSAAGDLARSGVSEGRDRIQSEIEDMQKRIADLTADLESRGRGAARQAGEKASALGQELEGTINRNPIAAILIAVGLGFVIGMASRGRQ
jgi:ElaB/YqjD/DUF883 family membrane-anchored ribosome-binding protein